MWRFFPIELQYCINKLTATAAWSIILGISSAWQLAETSSRWKQQNKGVSQVVGVTFAYKYSQIKPK